MNRQIAENIISSWNGKDDMFMCNGVIYTEEDVYEAEEFIKEEDGMQYE